MAGSRFVSRIRKFIVLPLLVGCFPLFPAYAVKCIPGGNEPRLGDVRFEETTRTMSWYDGTGWMPFSENPGECKGPPDCASVGAVCDDGTVFAGCTEPGYVPFFTTRCDAGQEWDGVACAGTRETRPWNNYNFERSGYTLTKVPDQADGRLNTMLLLAADANAAQEGKQPHQGAQYCADLDLHGHQDWYLPSRAELFLMWRHKEAIGNFMETSYWSSSEYDDRFAWFHAFRKGKDFQDLNPKYYYYHLRCARRN